ncbi:MAG: Type 1 glutamine amidotransferase-like domain-containing protein [Candidatus Dojkabacteria bacterium]|nr:Type 1 glutamine amidotransferase-like domain-containing protein [Candidatus Dojkabacteria bacterium]MDQ7020575.1 Type 1 glutamine amidotransferase-like domain-containing protein [Candidatus Dojkabacteria bacterium]
MSYNKLNRKIDEFPDVFPKNTKVEKLRDFPDSNLNLILSASSFVYRIGPILEEMLGESIENKKVVLIPNAGVGTEKVDMVYQYLFEFTTIHNMYLKMLDIERWPKEIILESIKNCDVLAFSGGLVSRLISSVEKTGIREEIVEIIKSGKPTMGFSSGAMVMSNTTHFALDYLGETDPEVKDKKPFGLVDFEIYPHFEDPMLPSIKSLAKNIKEAYTVKNDQALVIHKGKLIAIGEVQRL